MTLLKHLKQEQSADTPLAVCIPLKVDPFEFLASEEVWFLEPDDVLPLQREREAKIIKLLECSDGSGVERSG